eukprot:scaffold3401_cov277-Alexandrium_tamarense.AAC.12
MSGCWSSLCCCFKQRKQRLSDADEDEITKGLKDPMLSKEGKKEGNDDDSQKSDMSSVARQRDGSDGIKFVWSVESGRHRAYEVYTEADGTSRATA